MGDHPTAVWQGEYGTEWKDRNEYTPAELDALYEERYGVTRRELNRRFLQDVDHGARILEVGMNYGIQLQLLGEMGYRRLYGVDINRDVLRDVPDSFSFTGVAAADAMALPFPEDTFDLVYTSGVLIHIPQTDLPDIVSELSRVSRRFVWGFEYYAEDRTGIDYRGYDEFLWKDDFVDWFETHTDLSVVREDHVTYRDNDNLDTMYLLEA
jgi:pseudaminic acid biosynthesis-associated methylase